MNNFWVKLRLWTKVALFSIVGIYLILFLNRNWPYTVPAIDFPFFARYENASLLRVLLITAVASIAGWWLFRMIFRTIRQFKELRHRNRTARLEKEVAEMKAKAEMLKVKESRESRATVATPAPAPADIGEGPGSSPGEAAD